LVATGGTFACLWRRLTAQSGGSLNADDIDTLYKVTLHVALVVFLTHRRSATPRMGLFTHGPTRRPRSASGHDDSTPHPLLLSPTGTTLRGEPRTRFGTRQGAHDRWWARGSAW
jgi:hypothetical protein